MSLDTASPTTTATAMPSFAELGLADALVGALDRRGITAPFPIQAAAIPDALAGRDILGRGQTGSGKTMAFGLPLLTQIAERRTKREPNRPRALILAPTRELACQINDALTPYAQLLGVRVRPIFGGANMRPQIEGLRRGVDVVVATPGRLQDLIRQGECFLDRVEIAVLDEADQMCDLGFLQPVTELLNLTPADGQRLLFSATLDKGVQSLVKTFLKDPVTHSVAPEVSPVDSMVHHFLQVQRPEKLEIAAELLRSSERSIVFVRTKRSADRIAESLTRMGITSGSIHGDLAQNQRTRALAAFSEGRTRALVATDVAARGIHVDNVRFVLHFDPPTEHKAYLHRSGRTARAGETGVVATLVTHDQVGDVNRLRKAAGIDAAVRQVQLRDENLASLLDGANGATVGTLVSAPVHAPGGSNDSSGAARASRRPSPGQSARSNERAARFQGGGPRNNGGNAGGGKRTGEWPRGGGDQGPGYREDRVSDPGERKPFHVREREVARPARTERPVRESDAPAARTSASTSKGSYGERLARGEKPTYAERRAVKPQGGDHRSASRPAPHDSAKPAGRGQQQQRKVKPHRGQGQRPTSGR